MRHKWAILIKRGKRGERPRKIKEVSNADTYYLYLEGLANEVMHILQRHRRQSGFAIVDYVDVCLVQTTSDKLTSSILMFVDTIVERVRIVNFYSNPHFDVESKTYMFTCHFGHTYTFDIYMQKSVKK